MKFSKSKGGGMHASVQVIVRLSREDVEAIKEGLKRAGHPYNDARVREYVMQCTEYLPDHLANPDKRETCEDE